MKIQNEILDILAECRIEGNVLYLPDRQLDRATYLAVNKCLDSIGGKWNRKTKGHVFEYEPAEALENLIFTGETEDMKKKFQFFPTPRIVAEFLCDLALLDSESEVLEPSIGRGDLADVIWERKPKSLHGVELNPDMNKYVSDKPYTTTANTDFLVFADEVLNGQIRNIWNRVVMNPPFSHQQDIDHVYKAYEILNNGGILVSVMGPSPFFRTNRKSLEFREWLNERGTELYDLEEGLFKSSGTMIKTNVIKIRKNEN